MSKIKRLIQSRINELAILELEEEDMAVKTPEMTSISIRMPKDSVKQLDLIAEKLQLSRSDIARSFLESGSAEAWEAMNFSVTEVVDFLEAEEEKEIERFIEQGGNSNE